MGPPPPPHATGVSIGPALIRRTQKPVDLERRRWNPSSSRLRTLGGTCVAAMCRFFPQTPRMVVGQAVPVDPGLAVSAGDKGGNGVYADPS